MSQGEVGGSGDGVDASRPLLKRREGTGRPSGSLAETARLTITCARPRGARCMC